MRSARFGRKCCSSEGENHNIRYIRGCCSRILLGALLKPKQIWRRCYCSWCNNAHQTVRTKYPALEYPIMIKMSRETAGGMQAGTPKSNNRWKSTTDRSEIRSRFSKPSSGLQNWPKLIRWYIDLRPSGNLNLDAKVAAQEHKILQILENHIPISIVCHPRVRKEQHTACPQPPKVTARKAVALLLLSALVCGAEHE